MELATTVGNRSMLSFVPWCPCSKVFYPSRSRSREGSRRHATPWSAQSVRGQLAFIYASCFPSGGRPLAPEGGIFLRRS
jgi:hypothetical protein